MDRLFSSDWLQEGHLRHWYSGLESLGKEAKTDDPAFDKWTELVRDLLGVPVSLFSIIDSERQVFRSQTGLQKPWCDARETPLSHSFCLIVRRSGNSLVVNDAREDDRVRYNKAIEDLGVIAYLGAPVTMPDGEPIGSLCAIDTKPRDWSANDQRIIKALADAVSREVAMRVENSRRRAAEAQLERVHEHLNLFTALLSPDGQVMWSRQGTDAMRGGPQLELEGLAGWGGDTAAAAKLQAALRDAAAGVPARFDIVSGDGKERTAHDVIMTPVQAAETGATMILLTAIDITDRQAEEERRQVLTQEMAHRLRNLLSVITSIAAQTISGAADLQDAEHKLRQRLQALARSHEVLLTNDWHGADIRQILRDELRSFEGRYNLSGAAIVLEPQDAQTFALVVHELATNASKYGALSVPDGRLEIVCRQLNDGQREFKWSERGGPAAFEPKRSGFGSTILMQIAASQFEAAPDLTFGEDGFSYRLVW